MPHRPLVLDGGLDVRRLRGNQMDMEFISALQWCNTVIPEPKTLEDGFNRGVAAGCETEGEQLEVRFDLTGIEAAREPEAAKWNNFRSSSKTAL